MTLDMGQLLLDAGRAIAWPFVDPYSRVGILSMIFAGLFATVAWRRLGRPGHFYDFLIPNRVYGHPSARLDLKLYLVNALLKPAKLLTAGLSAAAAAGGLAAILKVTFGPAPFELPTGPWTVPVAGAVLFVTYDFATYVTHRLSHQIPILWAFHRLHHSAEVLTPLTLLRKHPVYDAIGLLFDMTIVGVVHGLMVYLMGVEISLAGLAASNVAFGGFAWAAGALRHSHVWLSFGPVGDRLVISPAMHQIHHSADPRHFDRNFGEVLAIWDILFRSVYVPKEPEALTFGLGEQPHPDLASAYLEPFAHAARSFLKPDPETAG